MTARVFEAVHSVLGYQTQFGVKGYKHASVLPRLRFCAIVAQNFDNGAAKTVPAGHLAHIDFGLSQDF